MPEQLKIRTLPGRLFDSCSYLVDLGPAGLLVDPAVMAADLPADLPQIKWIMATHGHIDHISEADDLRQTTRARLYIHEAEAGSLTDPALNLSRFIMQPMSFREPENLLHDGQRLELTAGYSLSVIHTPGHSPGSVCLLLANGRQPLALFTGDTLFAGSIGRTDLPGGDIRQMSDSLKLLAGLGWPDLPVYPGHGPATTLGGEISHNPYFR